MSDFLEQVIAERRADVAAAKARVPEDELVVHARRAVRTPCLLSQAILARLNASARTDARAISVASRRLALLSTSGHHSLRM